MSVFIPEIIKGGITAGEIAAGAIAGATVAGGIAGKIYPKGKDGYNIPVYDSKRGGYYLPGYSNEVKPGMILPNGTVFNPPAIPPRTSILNPFGGSGGVVIKDPSIISKTTPYNNTAEIQKAINKIIGSSSTSVIRYRYKTGQPSDIKNIKDALKNDPNFIDNIKKIIGDVPSETNSDDILKIISSDDAKRRALLDALKRQQIPAAPLWQIGTGNKTGQPEPDPDDPDTSKTSTDAINALKDKINKAAGSQGTETSPGEVTKTTGKNENKNNTNTRTKTQTDTDTKTQTKTDEDEEEEDPKPPIPDPPEEKKGDDIKERPFLPDPKNRKLNRQVQWYPEYNFGGQNMLKLTDVEKLEELKSYTLFDLVNPLLIGDENNLLALQNKIQENRRFTNTYPNPKPERELRPPQNIEHWRQPMRSIYPVQYPLSLDMPQAQNYYDRWSNQDYQYQDKKMDAIARGGTFDPDLEKILNNKRDSYTSTDKRLLHHTSTAKFSLLEDLDSSSITQLDLMILR